MSQLIGQPTSAVVNGLSAKLKWAAPACARNRPSTEHSQSAEAIVTKGQGVKCAGAISRETMLDLFRRGEVLPEGRTNEEEVKLVAASAGVMAVQGSL